MEARVVFYCQGDTGRMTRRILVILGTALLMGCAHSQGPSPWVKTLMARHAELEAETAALEREAKQCLDAWNAQKAEEIEFLSTLSDEELQAFDQFLSEADQGEARTLLNLRNLQRMLSLEQQWECRRIFGEQQVRLTEWADRLKERAANLKSRRDAFVRQAEMMMQAYQQHLMQTGRSAQQESYRREIADQLRGIDKRLRDLQMIEFYRQQGHTYVPSIR